MQKSDAAFCPARARSATSAGGAEIQQSHFSHISDRRRPCPCFLRAALCGLPHSQHVLQKGRLSVQRVFVPGRLVDDEDTHGSFRDKPDGREIRHSAPWAERCGRGLPGPCHGQERQPRGSGRYYIRRRQRIPELKTEKTEILDKFKEIGRNRDPGKY